MRRVQCRDCGKHYDYDKNDFCPKCGVYNSPGSTGTSRLEQELLARFGPVPQGRGRTATRPLPRKEAARPAYGGIPERSRKEHKARLEDCSACERPRRRKKGPAAVAVVVVVVLVILFSVAGSVLDLVGDLIEEHNYSYAEVAPAPEPAQGNVFHAAWEEFPLCGALATVEFSWWVELEEGSDYDRPGYDCVAVDVWITGGEEAEGGFYAPACVLLSDGTALWQETDPDLFRWLEEEYGVFAVTLDEARWNEPLYGSLVFFVPEGTAEEEILLCIPEYDDPESDPRAIHYITLSDWV